MNLNTVLFISGGTVAMMLIATAIRKCYSVKLWKILASSVLLTLSGVTSVKLMFFVENGNFSGLSFFGAVFFIPLFAVLIALLLRIKITDYLDIVAPSVAIMLSVMKINCLIEGCCKGMVIANAGTASEIRFPSQIFEMAVAAIIAILIAVAIGKGFLHHRAYPFFMAAYGSTRFVLNLFRETDDFLFGFGIGNMWAILSVIIGVGWLILIKKRERQTTEK